MRVARPILALCAGAAVAACSAAVTPGGAPRAAAASASVAGSGDAPPALGAITQEDLRRDLYTLAGDGMRGREAGTTDELRAAAWLADRAREAGLEPGGDDGTYFQFWSMRRLRQSDDSRIAVGGTPIQFGTEAAVLTPVDAVIDAPLVFLPAGTTPDEAAVRGKAVASELVPPAGGAASPRRYAGGAVRQMATRLIGMGAVAVVVVSDSIAESAFAATSVSMTRGRYGVDTAGTTSYWPDPRGGPARPPAQPPVIWVRRAVLDRLRAPNQRLTTRLVTENFLYPSVNVIGRVRGRDAALRDEYVLYSGHIDHDGVRTPIAGDSIWNGADDNGTVDVAMLADGRAFARNPGRRSVLFVWHGAEERGLLGSRYFVMHPTVPKSAIVAVLNGDMIGRNNPDTVTLLGSLLPHRNSSALVNVAFAANQRVTKFSMDTTWDMQSHPEGWYFRSDHLPYARAGIPAISFTTNLHEDYHTPRDEPSRIDYAKLTRITKWMYATGWTVANADRRPAVDPGFKLER